MLEIIITIIVPAIFATQLNLETSNLIIKINDDILSGKQFNTSTSKLLLFTLIALAVLFLARDFYSLPQWLKGGEPIWFLIIHVAIQELIFRTYMVNRLRHSIKNKHLITLITSLIFSLAHAILPINFTVIIFTFIGSLFWTHWHQKHANLPAVILSHSAVNIFFTMI